VRLNIVGAIVVIVPLIALFMLVTLQFLAPVFYPTVCISAADDVAQVTFVPAMPSHMLLRWSDAAGRVPMGLRRWSSSRPQSSSSWSWTGSATVVASSNAWRHLTCALTSLLSLGKCGVI
jgi:hypothetical protein